MYVDAKRYCAGQLGRGGFELGPNVDGLVPLPERIKEVSYYHRVRPCGRASKSNRCTKDTPFRGPGLRSGRSPTLGRLHSAARTAGFGREGLLLTPGAAMGPVDRLLHAVAPAS